MKGKMLVALLALGVSGQAAAQDPSVNLGQAIGNLVPNLTNTANSLLAMEITATTLSLNRTVTDLHMDLSQGTPLETNSSTNDMLMTLATPQTRRLDEVFDGEMGVDGYIAELQKLSTFDPALLFLVTETLLTSPEGPLQNPEIGSGLVLSLLPFNALADGAPSGGDSPLGALDPAMLTGLLGGLGGSGDTAFDLGMLTGLLAGSGDSPLGALDPAMLTALLGGSGDAAFDLGLLTGLLAGSGGDAGLPFDVGLLTGLLAGSGGAGGLPVGDLPLPLDALDPSTLTALLDGGTLPGL